MLKETNKKDTEAIQKLAERGARKLCAYGTCTAERKCSHANHICETATNISFDVCPLSKYEIEPDNTLWLSFMQPDSEPSRNERMALCAVCENAEGSANKQGEITFNYLNAEKCTGCPVLM